MSYESTKAYARKLGVYPAARWVHRQVMNRDALYAFRAELAFHAQLVEPGSLCFDVGANYGAKTEVFLRIGARVVAFEPQRDCLDELEARVGSHRHLVTVNAAVGSRAGRQTFYVEKSRTASSLNKDWQGEVVGSVEVPVTTLDAAIAKYGVPDYCKIDVEGHELEVFKGLHQRIPLLSFEYHLRRDGAARAVACLDYLSSFGDVFVNITPAEKPSFMQSHWWGKREFVEFFRQAVPAMPGYNYGDIFVRIERF